MILVDTFVYLMCGGDPGLEADIFKPSLNDKRGRSTPFWEERLERFRTDGAPQMASSKPGTSYGR
jgi:hypothetical protein